MFAAALFVVGCSFDSMGLGATETGAATTTTSTSTTTTTTTTTTTSTTTTTASGSGGSSGGESGLVSRGLLVRYFLDEGEGTTVEDSADDPLPLTIRAVEGQPAWSVQPGRGALTYVTEQRDAWVDTPTAGTKVESRLNGATAATIEVVVDVDVAADLSSRIVHIGPAMTNESDLALAVDPANVQFRIDGSRESGRLWPVDALLGQGRVVVHLVIDTAAADPQSRAILYVDGVEQPPVDTNTPAQGATIPVDPQASVGLFNRTEGERTFAGAGYYAAIYDVALEPTEVADNVAILSAGDDR
jgi:hypothetical protein